MTGDDPTLVPGEPARPGALPPGPAPATRGGPPRLGHMVIGAILLLVGVGWLLEALDLADVPWRFLLPSALIIVGAALVVGARYGGYGGLIAFGVVLTVLVLLAGAFEALVDIPLSGGIGETTRRPTAAVEDEYRWGVGKLTLDLRAAPDLAGQEIEASVVVGELLVIVPPELPLMVTARSGIGDVVVLGRQHGGFKADLICRAEAGELFCGDGAAPGRPYLRLHLRVAVGKVEVQR